jgi:hypothetical protein
VTLLSVASTLIVSLVQQVITKKVHMRTHKCARAQAHACMHKRTTAAPPSLISINSPMLPTPASNRAVGQRRIGGFPGTRPLRSSAYQLQPSDGGEDTGTGSPPVSAARPRPGHDPTETLLRTGTGMHAIM